MKYSVCNTGRVIVAKIEHGEEFVSGVKNIISKEKIDAGMVFFMGALKSGEIVACPKNYDLPPVSDWIYFKSPYEVVGLGTIFKKENEPYLHMHGALGRGEKSLVGCIRKIAEVYIIVEVIILEFVQSTAKRIYNEKSELNLLEP